MDEYTFESMRNSFRQDLMPWILPPLALMGAALLLLDLQGGPPPSLCSTGVLTVLLSCTIWFVYSRSFRLATWLLGLGLQAIALLTWSWFPDRSILTFATLPIIISMIIMDSASGIVFSILSQALIIVILYFSVIPYDTVEIALGLGALCGTTYLIFASNRPQKSLITWAWQSYEQAYYHLEQARNRQVELKQALQDLSMAGRETIRLNDMLSAARQAIEDALKSKEEFVANVSHELRTPLNMIVGFSEVILQSPNVYSRRLPPALMADVAAIKRNSQHLSALIDDVLDLVEADGGHRSLVREQTSIREIADEAIEAIVVLVRTKGLALKVDIDDNLPTIRCDRTRIRQVILNLLSNAARFTDKGTIGVRVRAENAKVIVSVADTGPGIATGKLQLMFQPFQQADASIRRTYGGSGLGLAISKRFVEMHGGSIWLESEVGKGTTATFTLPTEAHYTTEGPGRWFGSNIEYTPRQRPSSAPRLDAKPRIIVIERTEALTRLVSRHLDTVEAVHVPTADDARRVFNESPAVAIVVNDASSSAGEMLRHFPELGFDIPILSCWVPDSGTSLLLEGAQSHLVKPVTRDKLLDTIAALAPNARTVLIVDDEADQGHLLGRILASAGRHYTVLRAEDGAAALEILRDKLPDLLLLDLVMPYMDGFAVLAAKRADQKIRSIPTIIVSAKDPRKEPIVSQSLTVTRPMGLSASDIAQALEAIVFTLKPRFGTQARSEETGLSRASEGSR